jgi:hypothetical protein
MPLATLLNPDDPLYAFEHMMQHRQYFAVMSQSLSQFSILPYLLDPVFDQQQPASPWNLRHQQAHNDFNGDLPSNYENGYTTATITPAPAHGTGTSTGTTSLSVTAVTGTIMVGATVAGTGVPAGVTIVSQASGTTGGNGTYITSAATTLSAVALTMTHPSYVQAYSLDGGTFGIPQGQILLEGTSGDRSWIAFVNHQEHFIANDAILPLPTTSPTTAGTPPGAATVSNPWWWASRSPVIYPFW